MNARDIACTTKRRYPSKSQAKKDLKAMRARGVRTLVIYPCWHCEEFHLGNLPGFQTYARSGGVYGGARHRPAPSIRKTPGTPP